MNTYGAYIGLDTHKDTISVGVAEAGRGEPVYEREIANEPRKVFKLVEHLHQRYEGQELLWCYEAGPCGYVLYHQLMESGEECQVVAPSKTPRKPGDRGWSQRTMPVVFVPVPGSETANPAARAKLPPVVIGTTIGVFVR
uniref:Transposase n=1 Tax=Candidatus Kentrum sp. LPFa TaxID=2126335 RepID=A0A450VPJ5_9GAMM|nr:MAG: Transposase [Candidatus Kentron sp. LPFa]